MVLSQLKAESIADIESQKASMAARHPGIEMQMLK